MGSRPTSDLLVIVPALNESDSIGAVVTGARQTLQADVLVVDDGSTDDTAERAHAAGAHVVSLPYNLGVGGALRTALHFAARAGYERTVQIDGDGQHDAHEAKRLLDELATGTVDVVVGSRFAEGYDIAGHRRLAMRLLSRIVSRRVRVTITDTTSGFRAMNRRAIELFATRYPVDYLSDTVEALLIASDAGLRVREVNVRMHQRQGGRPSATSLRSLYHLLRLSLVILLHMLRNTKRKRRQAT